jgi:hypothetical protein
VPNQVGYGELRPSRGTDELNTRFERRSREALR